LSQNPQVEFIEPDVSISLNDVLETAQEEIVSTEIPTGVDRIDAEHDADVSNISIDAIDTGIDLNILIST